jgi:hypothetical protein
MLGSLFEQDDGDFPIFVEDDVALNHPDASSMKGKKKMEKPPDLRDPLGFVGLENQGATCYLNSLIQVMYMTPELREGLYRVDPMELGLGLVAEHEQDKANLEKTGTVEPDDNLLEALLAMGVEEVAARYALIKTKNKGIEDAFECIAELGDKPPPVQESPKKKKKPRYVPLELQRLFSELQLLNKATISTQDLTTKGFNWQSFDGRVQHDAHELNRLLVDGLEKSLKKTSGDTLCKTLYEGTMVNQILCTRCHRISEREESFYDLNMQVVDCPNVVQALHSFCKKEVLDGDSAYACENCKVKTKAYRCSKLKRLPNILTFSCNRFKIDRSTNWQRVKVTSASNYPLALNMNPFVYGYTLSDTAMDVEDDQTETELVSIAHNTMAWIDTIKQEAESYLDTCFAISRIPSLSEFQWTPQQIDHFRRQVILSLEDKDPFSRTRAEENYRYALHAIIIHRGSAYSGHYYAYVRDNLFEANYLPTDPSAFVIPSGKDQTSTSNGKSKARSANTGTANSSSQTNENIEILDDYLFDEVTLNTFVCQDSLIHKILFIFEEEQSNFVKSVAKRRGGFKKPFFLKSGAISRGIATHFQENWTKMYKAKHGTIDEFLQKHKSLFVETEPTEFSLQADLVTSIIPEDAYRSLYISKQPKSAVKSTAATPVIIDVNDDSNAMDVDSDELLARALQESLNRESAPQTRSAPTTESQSAWQTAAKKKDRKSQHASKEPVDIVDTNAEEKAKLEQEAALLQRKRLVEDLLRFSAGLFLEFNDSRVSHITYDTLQQAFQGVDSAYLIVYRRVKSYGEIFPLRMYSSVTSMSGPSQCAIPRPIPPASWQEKIQTVNQQLTVQRTDYSEHLQQRVISVYFQSSLHYDCPCFVVNINGAAEKASSNTPCIHVDVDTRKTMQDLLAAIFCSDQTTYCEAIETLSHEKQDTNGQQRLVIDSKVSHLRLLEEFQSKYALPSEITSLMTSIAVSRLEPVVALTQQGQRNEFTKAYNHCFYASTPALLSDSIGDYLGRADPAVQKKMGSHSMLMIWLPATAGPSGIIYGDNARPVPIKSWILELPNQQIQKTTPQSATKAWGKAPAPATTGAATPTNATSIATKKVSSSNDPNEIRVTNAVQLYYVPGNLTLFDAILFLAQKYGLDVMRQVVRARVPDVAAATAAATASYSARATRASVKATSQTDHSKVATVFEQGVVSFQAALQLLGNSGNLAITDATPISELWFVRELYMEDYTAQGFHKASLAERFLALQLHMISVTVEFDTSIVKLMQKADPDYELPDSVDVEVFKTATLASLKEKVLAGYGLLTAGGATMESCRLRLGSKPGEAVLENELEVLDSLGIKNGTRLYLETGSIARAPETVILNFLVVHGNSTSMKYPANEAGWRVGEAENKGVGQDPKPITIEVPLSLTVRELRDMVGARLLQFPPEWTELETSLLPVNSLDVSTLDAAAGESSTAESSSLTAFKDLLKQHSYYQHHEYRGRRLRRTSWMGEYAELLLEVDKKQATLTLKEAELKDGDLLLLEEGRLPVRGKHDLQVYFWHDHPLMDLPTVSTDQNGTSDDNTAIKDDDSVMIVDDPSANQAGSPSVSFSEKVALAQRQRFQCLHRLGEIQVSVNGTLGEMHTLVSELVKRSRDVLMKRISSHVTDESITNVDSRSDWDEQDHNLWSRLIQPDEFLLLREMRPDTLPGKCFWMVDSTHSVSTTPSSTAAPATPGDVNSKLFGSSGLANTPLKKLSLKTERGSIVVQLLPRSQIYERSSSGSIRIWAQRLLNPQHAAAGEAQLSPSWPPVAAVLQGGIAPTLGHLHRAILNAIPNVATGPEHLVVYKYNLQKFAWEEMKHLNDGTSSKKKVENLFQAPYNVKEGSLFCAFSKMDLLPSSSSGATTTQNQSKVLSTISTAMDISLPMDLFMQQERAEAAMRKKMGRGGDIFSSNGSGGEKTGKDILKKPEHQLALYIDFDDWDDE